MSDAKNQAPESGELPAAEPTALATLLDYGAGHWPRTPAEP